MSISDWEEANPAPQFDETEYDSEMEQYEWDEGFKRRVDNWNVQRASFEERSYSHLINNLKERIQQAHTLESIRHITEQIEAAMEKRNSFSGYIKQKRDEMSIEDYDRLPPWRQQEVDRADAFQSKYDMYRNEY